MNGIAEQSVASLGPACILTESYVSLCLAVCEYGSVHGFCLSPVLHACVCVRASLHI